MNDEPTYDYVKGVGWVPSMTRQVSRVENGYLITLIERHPKQGERGLTIMTNCSLEENLRQVNTHSGWDCTGQNWDAVRRDPDCKRWVTIVVEKI